jgi:hypothetical protein
MGHCGEYGYSLWATAVNMVIHSGPLRRIWGKFGYALRATAANLVIHYGPLSRMKWYSKNLHYFRAIGHLRNIWLRAIGHNAVFGYAL